MLNRYRLTVNSFESRGPNRSILVVAASTVILSEEFLPFLDLSHSRGTRLQPALVISRRQDLHITTHGRMVGTTILSAEDPKPTNLGWTKPQLGVTPRQNVLLHPEGRNEETMNHILRDHVQTSSLTQRHMQFVNFFLACRMLSFPHPLLANHVNDCSISRRGVLLNKKHGRYGKHRHQNDERHTRPDQFQNGTVSRRVYAIDLASATIADSQNHRNQRHEKREEQTDRNFKPKGEVITTRKGGSLFREKTEIPHGVKRPPLIWRRHPAHSGPERQSKNHLC